MPPWRTAAVVGTSRYRLGMGLSRKEVPLSLVPSHFGRRRRPVVESFGTFAHDPPADEAFERAQRAVIFRCHKADSIAHRLGPARPANAVDVVLGVHWEVIIDDVR